MPNELIMPFSPDFEISWQLWKDYKKDAFNFVYKGLYSEQMTLKQLVDLSDGDEQKAIKIIEQSIRRQWQGLFPLHETTSSKNGKSKQSKSDSPKDQAGSGSTLRERVQTAVNNRYGNGKQSGDEPYLKAV